MIIFLDNNFWIRTIINSLTNYVSYSQAKHPIEFSKTWEVYHYTALTFLKSSSWAV